MATVTTNHIKRFREKLWAMVDDGFVDEQFGTVDHHGWFGIIRLRRQVAIFHQDPYGFKRCGLYDHERGEHEWSMLRREFDHDD